LTLGDWKFVPSRIQTDDPSHVKTVLMQLLETTFDCLDEGKL
jgi:hypothetical protein